MKKPTPFVKWAGGKSQLLKKYKEYYPKKFNTYYEPFLGGGAVFFDLCSLGRISKAVLSDFNSELMNLWAAVKWKVEELISELEPLQKKVNNSRDYYEIRIEYNNTELNKDFLLNPHIRKAALLLYLNRTCYNGLYRVNVKGKFNVPFGRYKNPRLVDRDNLMMVRKTLNDGDRIELRCEDFGKCVENAKRGDFIYFDPPYQPLNATSSFTGYTAGGFGIREQKRLSKVFKRLDRLGCYEMLSNSHSEEVLRPLYKKYFIDRAFVVQAPRAISCVGTGRGLINELVILSYNLSVKKQSCLIEH